MSGTGERGAEKAMDDYLKSIGLHRKRIAKDGSCLFRAVAEQVLHCQSLHTKVRAKCVEFLRQNRASYEAFIEGDFEEYLTKLQDPQQWVGEVEINALAIMYKRDFLIYQEPGKQAVNITDNNFKDQVRLCFLNGNHYDSVYPVSHIKSAALCQSVLYELLYDGVFKADRSLVNLCNRPSRPSDLLSDDNMAACGSSDESDGGASEPLWLENETSSASTKQSRGRGRGRPLPERVRRSLNQTLYRNVEYDVWHKTKRAQQKMDYSIAAGMQFTVGDRCQVRLEGSGRSYNATIKEVPLNNGPVTVHIEELGRKQVPLWSLRPPSDRSSWSTVVSRDKKLSNGHGEWEDRGRGRGRGRSLPPAAAAASQAPAAGGRVQKQHSWPPQASAEEGPRSGSRKSSTSAVDAAFGLTEEQRQAKIEEEMNVALVEIQLRDELSFPALGAQAGAATDGGRKKKRPQSDTVKSLSEDVRPPAGERPKSSTPPLTDAPPSSSSHPDSDSTPLSSLKAATPNTNMAAAPTAAASCASASAPVPAPAGGAVPPSVPASATRRSFLPPVLPSASSSSPPPPSSSLPPKSSASLPPSLSSLPPPTFISPIAPSPAAAQGFLPRASPPAPSLPQSSTPPLCSSSEQRASSVPHEAPVCQWYISVSGILGAVKSRMLFSSSDTLVVAEGASNASQPSESPAQTQDQISEDQIQPPPPSSPTLTDQIQTEPQSSLSHPHPLSEPGGLPESQPEVVQIQSSRASGGPGPDAPTEQAPPSAPYPHPQLQQTQPPHPSQVPHPSPSLSSPPHAPVQLQTTTHSQPEAPPPTTNQAQTQSDSQSHPPHPLLPLQPPHPQSIPGTVPLQQLSQLYQDPLYPGFPQTQKGDMVPTPHFSSSKSGDDLPPDVNVLRFFFNLGVKAYSMPMFPPYVYLLPLQQAHTLQPKIPSRTPSPPPNPPPRHQEVYHPQYPQPPTSMPPPYDRQAPPPDHAHPSDPSFSQAGYPVSQPLPHRVSSPSLSWQQHQMPPPRNPPFTVGYPTPSPPYPLPQSLHQGFHPGPAPGPGPGPGHPLYTQSVSPYPPSSLGYHSGPAHEELQLNQVEQHPPPNGDTVPGLRMGQGPGPAAVAAPNRPAVVPGFGAWTFYSTSLKQL
ncbi:uncharacterized protein V6R79_016189 [Siganus canaliculatus]